MLIPHFPHFLHGGDYNPDQWLESPEIIDEDFRLFDLAGCNTFSLGIFSWSRYEAEEGTYDFRWLDAIMDRMAAAGKNVILATPSGAKPFWLAEKYEEVRRVNRDGRREPSRGRHNHCWTSPVYREKVLALNTRLAERFGGHPALKMWHVSNEYNGECLCELCVGRFQQWLKERYGDLETLNRAYWSAFWSHRFTAWEQIRPFDESLDGLALDWKRFVSWQVVDFYQFEAAPLRAVSQLPVLTNLMGFFDGVNYHELAPHLDIVGDDSYPIYDADSPDIAGAASKMGLRFDLLRCLKGEPRPWFLMESCIDGSTVWAPLHLKPPGLHHLEMFQAVAHGAEGTMYFQMRKGRGGFEKYHGSLLHHTHAQETRGFREVSALSRRYEKITEILGSLNRAEVALILDWEARWAYQTSRGLPHGKNSHALVEHAERHYRAFWRRGITVDVLGAEHDFSGYKLLILPRLYLLRPGLAERLRAYVEAGGVVLATALTGMVNETNLCFADGCPGDGLEELAGVWMEEFGQVSPHAEMQVAGEGNPFAGQWKVDDVYTTIHLRGAQALLHYADGWTQGQAAFTVNARGAGKFYYLAADLETAGLDHVYEALARELALPAHFSDAAPLPDGVTVQRRESGEKSYSFLLNFNPRETRVTGVSGLVDLETGGELGGEVILQPWEARVCRNESP